MSILLGKGDGTFGAQTTLGTDGQIALDVSLADFNGDAKSDTLLQYADSGACHV